MPNQNEVLAKYSSFKTHIRESILDSDVPAKELTVQELARKSLIAGFGDGLAHGLALGAGITLDEAYNLVGDK